MNNIENSKEIVFPDYSNCIINTTASIMRHYGIESIYSENKIISELLKNNYKNVVLMIFDGLGTSSLNLLDKKEFLNRNKVAEVTSVYPSTTTAAMTAYHTGLSPLEHGWIGWSLYFKEYGRCLDTFLNRDSYSQEMLELPNAGYAQMPFHTIFDKIEEAAAEADATAVGKSTVCSVIQPKGLSYYGKKPYIGVDTLSELCDQIKQIAKGGSTSSTAPYKGTGNNFIFSYWPEPDSTMHKTGCSSIETTRQIAFINDKVEQLCAELKDTLVIISADHGLIDSSKHIYINDFKELDECLIMPPFIEPRCLSFHVKPDKKELFKERFNASFSQDFILYTKEEVMDKGLLGLGTEHNKISDFVGDYLACANGVACMKYYCTTTKEKVEFKGNHAGLTSDEMKVPIIAIACR